MLRTREGSKELFRQWRNGPTPALTVDAVILRDGEILLIRRGRPPFQGMWALPGGFVDVGETVEEATLRELLEEAGVEARIDHLVGVFSKPGRDPRGHTISIAFCLEWESGEPVGGDDAADARWFPVDALPELAFDHAEIVAKAMEE